EWTRLAKQQSSAVLSSVPVSNKVMPSLNGMGLKDALYICENAGLVVKVRGLGKVTDQSINAGSPIAKGQVVSLDLKMSN
ncbi:MAG TPA: PASTA domain-containing protein, partial [Parafilimonas sp.]|nr:PASTA domain-containing protein [Parafilimonas sp.]